MTRETAAGRLKTLAQAILFRNHIPTAFAFVLLACQMAIPWTAANFIAGDGPSHLYNAAVAGELVLHRHSIYSSVYFIRGAALPNWSTTVFLAVAGAAAGNAYAEKIFASFAILAGFLGFCYLNRALAPNRSPWTPIANFLFQTWFLWVGFYNFYLGVALLLFIIGFYIRGTKPLGGRLSRNRAVAIAVGLVAIFYTHLIAVVFAIATMVVICLWVNAVAPAGERSMARSLRETGMLLLSAAPAAILILLYLHSVRGAPVGPAPDFLPTLRDFPKHIFLTGTGSAGQQAFLGTFTLCYLVAGLLLLTKKEWGSARAGLVIAALAAFAAYLLVPNRGFGGSEATTRFAWLVFILGVPAAASASRIRFVHTPVALCIAFYLGGNFVATVRAARAVSDAVVPYLSTAGVIPPNSSIVRLLYPAPDAPERYGYAETGRSPFFHLDSLVAVRNHDLDLTDYESFTRAFPVRFRAEGQSSQLWGFEGPDVGSVESLAWVRANLPFPVDFVLLFGDERSPEAIAKGMPAMLAYLDSNMTRIAVSPDRLLRIYRRNE